MELTEIKAYLKALDAGATLNDRELVALLLDGCSPFHSGYDAADTLISRYGSFSDISEVPSKDLMKIEGVGLEGARIIKSCRAAVFAMLRENSTDKDPYLFTFDDMINYLRPNFVGLDCEYCFAFLLNERYRLVHGELIGRGNFDQVPLNFRRIMKLIGRYDAAKLIIAHNHMATIYPSDTDVIITNKLNRLLYEIDVDLIDHVIFCENEYLSLRKSGYLKELKQAESLKLFPQK